MSKEEILEFFAFLKPEHNDEGKSKFSTFSYLAVKQNLNTLINEMLESKKITKEYSANEKLLDLKTKEVI